MNGTRTALDLPCPVRTPLLHSGDLLLKSERSQIAGSAKYRMVFAKVARAIREGRISENTMLAEVTSGSTGIALAYAGSRLGLRVELHAYESISDRKRQTIEEFGGKLVVHRPTTPVAEMLQIVSRQAAQGRCWHLNQYDRESTVEAYADFARELADQLHRHGDAIPQVFLCPVGTGGLIQGLGRPLRAAFPGIRVVALEPEADACIDGIRNTARCHGGLTDPYDKSFPDEVIRVPHPGGPIVVENLPLGESSAAAFLLARSKRWKNALVMAPD